MSASLIISVLSQKGGVGKSTIARLIARTYAAAGWRAKIADFNTKQKTAVDWTAMRLESDLKPEIQAEAYTSVKTALRNDIDLLVIDGRPDSDTTSLDCAKVSHLVLIPTGESLDDLKPQVLFAHELAARGIDKHAFLFILNNTTSDLSVSDAKAYIREAGYQSAKTDLPHRTGYKLAQNRGMAISETSYPPINDRADALAMEIVERATQRMGN